ncbi:TPA: Fic family protein [Streptococcus suis]
MISLLIAFQNELTEEWIKEIYTILKRGTSEARKSWVQVGNYKSIPNEVGGEQTSLPENVATDMARLIKQYHNFPMISIEDILDFHVQFERIHPFQDGNGRVGHLIMFKECLKHNHVSFIISDDMKYFYYRCLSKWRDQKKWFLA